MASVLHPRPATTKRDTSIRSFARYMTVRELTIEFDVSEAVVYKALRDGGVKAVKRVTRDSQRNAEMRELRADGETLEEIGRAYGITRERVRQICDGIEKPKRGIAPKLCAACGEPLTAHGNRVKGRPAMHRTCRMALPPEQRPRPKWDPELVLEKLRLFVEVTGRLPKTGDISCAPTHVKGWPEEMVAEAKQRKADLGLPTMTTLNQVFGGLPAALRAAGFEYRQTHTIRSGGAGRGGPRAAAQARRDAMWEDYLSGLTAAAVARKHKVSVRHVYYVCSTKRRLTAA